MFLLTKILSLLVYPLSLGLVFLVLALISQMRKRRGSAALFNVLGVGILYFCSTGFGSEFLLTPLEARYPAFSPEELPKAEAIVVLGGGLSDASKFGRGMNLREASDRVVAAAELYHAGMAPVLVVSGGAVEGPVPEAERMTDLLGRLGVPSDVISKESTSVTTYENAVNVAEILNGRSIKHILLVTSGDHMYRANAVFAAQGFQITPAPTDHLLPRYPETVPVWLPTVARLERSTRAVHEWVGYYTYKLTGKL